MLTKEQAEIAAKAILEEKEKALVLDAEKRARWRALPGKWTLILAAAGGLAGFAIAYFFLEDLVRASALGVVFGSVWGRYLDRPVSTNVSRSQVHK